MTWWKLAKIARCQHEHVSWYPLTLKNWAKVKIKIICANGSLFFAVNLLAKSMKPSGFERHLEPIPLFNLCHLNTFFCCWVFAIHANIDTFQCLNFKDIFVRVGCPEPAENHCVSEHKLNTCTLTSFYKLLRNYKGKQILCIPLACLKVSFFFSQWLKNFFILFIMMWQTFV